jgi:putative nucleotidyltransferase with HDIG domain
VLAERIRRDVQKEFKEEPIPLTICFGVAAVPDCGITSEPLLRAADQALYSAKAAGRNKTVVYAPDLDDVVGEIGPTPFTGNKLGVLLSLAETLDVRGVGTGQHSRLVGRYAELTARALGLPPEAVERVRLAGVLHDIGKIAVPDSVLNKPGPLNLHEVEIMREHPEIAARMLDGDDLEDIRDWVLCHHERPDGRGYPRGLSDDSLSLEARILAVADAYEAMTSKRVYRKTLSSARAGEELLNYCGSQFDKRVVQAFLNVLAQEDAGSITQAA